MLTLVHARNFGAIGADAVDVPLAKVTVLVGENGTGKSTVLRALGVLAQTASSRDRLGLVHDGTRARFETYEDLCFGRDASVPISLGVDISLQAERLQRLSEYRPSPPARLSQGETVGIAYRCYSQREPRSPARLRQEVRVNGRSAIADMNTLAGGRRPSLRFDGGKAELPAGSVDQLLDPSGFVPQANATEGDSVFPVAVSALAQLLTDGVRPVATVRGAETFSPEPTTRATERTGPSGAFTLQFIHEQSLGDPKAGKMLVGWLELLGLHGFRVGVVASKISPLFDDSVSRASLPLYLAGYGHQQILQLLAELAFAPAGAVITAEEPENSLHPGAQIAVAAVIVDAIRTRDVQVILSTQSPTLALAFCRAVRRGALKAADLSLTQMTRDENGTRANRLQVDDAGMVHPAWISSFAKAEADLLRDFTPAHEDDAPRPPKAKRSRSAGHRR